MDQRLGFRSLVFYIIKGVVPGLILLLMALVILAAKNLIINGFVASGYAGGQTITTIILYAVGGLYIGAILFIALGLVINLIRYVSTTFVLDEYGFKIHRGLISKEEQSIPYRQIQDVNLDQSIFYRIIGIAKVIILTAANDDGDKHGETSEVIFDIVDISLAKYLQSELSKRGSIQLVKNA